MTEPQFRQVRGFKSYGCRIWIPFLQTTTTTTITTTTVLVIISVQSIHKSEHLV